MNMNPFSVFEWLTALFEAMTFSVFCTLEMLPSDNTHTINQQKSVSIWRRKQILWWFRDALQNKQLWRYLIITVLAFVGTIGKIYLPFSSAVNAGIFYLLLSLVIALLYGGSFLQNLLCLLLFVSAEIIGQYAAEYIAMSLISTYSVHSSNTLQAQLFTLILSKLISYILVVIICATQSGKRKKQAILYHAAILLMPLLSIIEVIVIYPLDWVYITQESGIIFTTLAAASVLFSNIFIFWLFRNLSKDSEQSEESILMKQQIHLQQIYLYELQQRDQSVRSMWHDMNNHLETIRRIRLTGDMQEVDSYIDQLSQRLCRLKPHCDCGISIIDAVVNSKYEWASSLGIQMNIQATVSSLYNISTTDVGSLISNMLDNAIEACERIKSDNGEPIRKIISFTVRNKGGFLIFHCVNPLSQQDANKKNITESTKSNRDIHGIGLRNIRSVAERYNGNVAVKQEKGNFVITVMLQTDQD